MRAPSPPSHTSAAVRAAIVVGVLAAAAALAPVSWRTSATSAAQVLQIGERTLVATAPASHVFAEPHLVVHPSRPSHLLAATVVQVAAKTYEERLQRMAETTCATLLSLDGGRSWTRHDFSITGCYDPWVAITPDDHAIFVALGTHPTTVAQGQAGLVAFRSKDGGRTWDETPIGLGRSFDHPTLAVDSGRGARAGTVYLLAQHQIRDAQGRTRVGVFVAASTDGGTTFAPSDIVPNNLISNTEMPVVLSDGALVASFVESGPFAPRPNGSRLNFERRRAWVLRSTDGARTFSPPLFVNDACGPPPPFQQSRLVVDAGAGPFRDRLYFVCRRHGGGPVVVNYSIDGGESWSDPVPLPGIPDDANLRRVPVAAVNDRGVLGIAWIERRIDAGDRCQHAYVTASLDGGESFMAPQRLAPVACPPSAELSDLVRIWPTSGDYFGMIGTANGFMVLWSEAFAGDSHLWSGSVEVADRTRGGR